MAKYGSTQTGSWFRTPEISKLLPSSPSGEISSEHRVEVEVAERRAIRDQVHPNGSAFGLSWVSNGEQRKSGYTSYLPSRYHGFDIKNRVPVPMPGELIQEFQESNPGILATFNDPVLAQAFALPKIVDKLSYHGEAAAVAEAKDAVRLAKEEGAKRIFLPSASPGVTTLFFGINKEVYRDHSEYLDAVEKEQKKEYRAILSVDGVDLQIDAPDLAMAKRTAGDWDVDFYTALPEHVDAINESVAGLPSERIRVHYCYGNWNGSHSKDADFSKIVPELARLKVGTIVGEFANPRHEGDVLALRDFVREHSWPKNLKFAIGVIDVKTPIVESPATIRNRLEQTGSIIGEENVLGGTDCGFETFAGFDNIPYPVALQKLESLGRAASGED